MQAMLACVSGKPAQKQSPAGTMRRRSEAAQGGPGLGRAACSAGPRWPKSACAPPMRSPVPKDSSPQMEHCPASMRLPKNFQPVGVSKKGSLSSSATRSSAPLVGMERATPCGREWWVVVGGWVVVVVCC